MTTGEKKTYAHTFRTNIVGEQMLNLIKRSKNLETYNDTIELAISNFCRSAYPDAYRKIVMDYYKENI